VEKGTLKRGTWFRTSNSVTVKTAGLGFRNRVYSWNVLKKKSAG
jgi:hypothetical protein